MANPINPIPDLPFVSTLFLLNAVITIGMQLFFFLIAYSFQIDKVTDLAGALNFVAIAIFSLVLSQAYTARVLSVFAIVVASRLYLGGFLFWRVLQRGHDARFDEMRSNCAAFFGFWVFQMVWAFGVSVTVIFVSAEPGPSALGALDYAGMVIGVACLLIQAVADVQKARYRADPTNKGHWCDVGVWTWCRHPNFFGEIGFWWGIFLLVVPSALSNPTGFATILSPLLTMAILLFLSGMPTAEGQNQARFLSTPTLAAEYNSYRNRTPPIIPFPSFLYSNLPLLAKRIFCCEFRMYEYQEEEHNISSSPLVAQPAGATAPKQ